MGEARADVNLGSQVLGESTTIVHHQAGRGDALLLQKLLAARADIDRQEAKQGFSALHFAARAKRQDVVQLLLDADADMQLRTAGGKTASEIAAVNGASDELLRIL